MTRTGERAARRQLAAEVLDLHAEGLSVTKIAVHLGTTPARAQRLLSDALASIPESDIDELRLTSEIRLDRLAATFGGLLDDPDPRIRLQAANGLAGVERDRSRLLGTSLARPKEPD